MDWRAVTAVVVSTLTLVVDHYHHVFAYAAYESLLFYLGVPLFCILVLFRDPPAAYGFRLGDWKAGLLLTAGGCLGITLVMALVGRTPAFRSYYGGTRDAFTLAWVMRLGLELLGWEFVFRGFLLFGLYRICGPHAIVLQAVPFTIAHFGKPELETLSCIFGGSAFGYVAWRTGSFLYPFLIHWYLMTITVCFANG